jgi:hypothetical protein
MGRFAALTRRVPAVAKGAAVLAPAWAFVLWGLDPVFHGFHWLNRVASWGGLLSWYQADAVGDVIRWTRTMHEHTLVVLAFVMTLAVPIGMLIRTVARARLRAGFDDPLERVRAWTKTHAWGTRAVLAVPALGWAMEWTGLVLRAIREWGQASMYGEYAGTPLVEAMHSTFTRGMAIFWCGAMIAALGVYALANAGKRALLAPTLVAEESPAKDTDDRLHFDAVAVTSETRGAVVAMAVLPVLAVLACAGLGPKGTEAVLAAYVTLAVGGVWAFRKASRVAIGLDGVYVSGSSRARFFAYARIDGVRAVGNNLELVRGGKPVLRLQLHGRDAASQGAILRRIEESIRRAHEGESRAAGEVVKGSSARQLARLAEGGADYRAPAVTREQLWSLVEGPEHDQATRTAAAKALATTGDDDERARLRVAADHYAEPRSRVVLRELATIEEEEDDVGLRLGVPVRTARLAR